MPKIPFSERLGALAFGGFAGVAVGLFAAWFAGVYRGASNATPISFIEWALWGAGIFGSLGFIIGSHVGTLVGNLISGFYDAEANPFPGLPTWLVVALLVALVLGVSWYVYS